MNIEKVERWANRKKFLKWFLRWRLSSFHLCPKHSSEILGFKLNLSLCMRSLCRGQTTKQLLCTPSAEARLLLACAPKTIKTLTRSSSPATTNIAFSSHLLKQFRQVRGINGDWSATDPPSSWSSHHSNGHPQASGIFYFDENARMTRTEPSPTTTPTLWHRTQLPSFSYQIHHQC